MKGKTIITGVIMTMAVLGTSLAAMADDTNAEKAEAGFKQQGAEESLIRNEEGRIVGIDVTLEPVSVYYQETNYEQLISSNQFREYKKLGLTCDNKTKTFYFHGMEVNSLEDEYEEGHALQYLTEKWGENSNHPSVDLYAVRDEDYHLLYFKFYRLLTYDIPYNFEDDEYGIEDEMWDEGVIAVDELSEWGDEPESLPIIGGADEPTEISLEGASGDDNEAVNWEEHIKNLYDLKTSDAKDAWGLSNIMGSFLVMDLMPELDYLVDIKDNGSCLIIQFVASLPNTDETIQNLSDCGNILLALVDELSEVRFTYPVEQEGKIQCTLYWDKQAAKEALGRDVKEYGKSLDEFIKLFHF